MVFPTGSIKGFLFSTLVAPRSNVRLPAEEITLADLREAFTEAPAPRSGPRPRKKKERVLEDELGDAFAARGLSTEILSVGLEELATVLEESLPAPA